MNIEVGTLCFTCGSRIPANNNLLVVVTCIDPTMAPEMFRIRRVTGETFYSTRLPNGERMVTPGGRSANYPRWILKEARAGSLSGETAGTIRREASGEEDIRFVY